MPKNLFPRLGDLPKNDETVRMFDVKMREVTKRASQNPRVGPEENAFISPHFADWLECDLDPESAEVADIIRHGLSLKKPSVFAPMCDSAGSAPIQHDICSQNDLLKGIVSGTYLGPFPYTGQTHVSFDAPDRSGKVVRFVNKINPAPVFRVKKAKKLMEYAGRMVCDLKRNMLNSDYDFAEATISFPRFREIIKTNQDMKYMFIVDFIAAYRQIRYAYDSWGFVVVLFRGSLYIDIAMTFGLAIAARIFQRFSRTLIRALAKYFPTTFLEMPIYIPNNTSQLFVDARVRHRSWIDDLKFVSECFSRACNMIHELKVLKVEFNIQLEFVSGDFPVVSAVYVGWMQNLEEQAICFPVPKRKALLGMVTSFLRGKTWTKDFDGNLVSRPAKGLFTLRELQQLHGSLNSYAFGYHSVFVKLTPLIIFIGKVSAHKELSDLIKVSFVNNPWLFRAMTEIRKIVRVNAWVPFKKFELASRCFEREAYCFADAAGEEEDSFGAGGLSISAGFAFQVPHALIIPFLLSVQDSNATPDHIMNSELLVQLFLLWFGFSNGYLKSNSYIELSTDNQGVF